MFYKSSLIITTVKKQVILGKNFCKREKILFFSRSFKSDSPIKKVFIEVLFFISINSSFVFKPLSEINGEGWSEIHHIYHKLYLIQFLSF